MLAPILLYSGPAIAPQLARVSLWGTTPHHNLVLYDENAGMVLGAVPTDLLAVHQDGTLTVGEWQLGPEVVIDDLASQPFKPFGQSELSSNLGTKVRVLRTTTRLVLIPRAPGNPADAVTLPLGRLRAIGQERIVLTWWGERFGFVGGSGCGPCERAAAKLAGVGL